MASDHHSKKRKYDASSSSINPLALVLVPPKIPEKITDDGARKQAELLFREHTRLTLDINPLYTSRLEGRREIGFYHHVNGKKLDAIYFEINVREFRRCITDVLTKVLTIRYYSHGNLRDSEIATELAEIVPLTVSATMCALYAKLRSIHRAYGKLTSRYTTPPRYTKEVELPLPLAIAIQDFGTFQTSCLPTNYVFAPTYPEGTLYEGRADADFNITDYLSYIPTFRQLGLPLKTVDPVMKKGTSWWTYQVSNSDNTTDLTCILPPSLYTPLSAQIRSLFLATKENSTECSDIISFTGKTIVSFGVRLCEAPPNTNVRTFLALSHGPLEEWSNGAPDV